MLTEIGIYQAKTHFADIARRSEAGESFLIKRNGKAVCKITPLSDNDEQDRIARAEAAYGYFKKAREDMRKRGIKVTQDEIMEWIKEGRRY